MNNKLILIALIILSNVTIQAQNSDPVAHYKFNVDVKDESPNGNHGKIIGNLETTQDRFGNNNGAFYFTGNGNSFIEIPSSPSLESPKSQITIARFVRREWL